MLHSSPTTQNYLRKPMKLAGSCSFLSNWMEQLLPLIGDQDFLDLSLPGTHDSLTYDLSDTYADNSNNIPSKLSWIMHNFISDLYTFGDFGKTQARTQSLDIKQQLDNGIRFIDMRAVYTQDKPKGLTNNWYSLHFMQSKQKLIDICKQIREWIDEHPKEVLVIEITYHGNGCDDKGNAYPGITNAQKLKFWKQYEALFEEILFNTEKHKPLNQTTLNELISQNSRIITYISDYVQFTNSSPYAQNGCLLDQHGGGSIYDPEKFFNEELEFFDNVKTRKQELKAQNRFFTCTIASSEHFTSIYYAWLERYLQDYDYQDIKKSAYQDCLGQFKIPSNEFCPLVLYDLSQWNNFYQQTVLQLVRQRGNQFPNAVYVDQLDIDGTIRVGTNTDRNYDKYEITQTPENSKFVYSDTIILANIKLVCESSNQSEMCKKMINEVMFRINLYPAFTWTDDKYGRQKNWPQPF